MAKLWKSLSVLAAAAFVCAGAQAQSSDMVVTGDLQWKEIVPGVNFAATYGDWGKGAHGKFVRIDHGAQVPMHLHSNEYHAVFVSGRMANLFEGDQRIEVGPGDYFHMAAKRPHAHECLAEDGCLFYTYGEDLWDIEVVDAE